MGIDINVGFSVVMIDRLILWQQQAVGVLGDGNDGLSGVVQSCTTARVWIF